MQWDANLYIITVKESDSKNIVIECKKQAKDNNTSEWSPTIMVEDKTKRKLVNIGLYSTLLAKQILLTKGGNHI